MTLTAGAIKYIEPHQIKAFCFSKDTMKQVQGSHTEFANHLSDKDMYLEYKKNYNSTIQRKIIKFKNRQ